MHNGYCGGGIMGSFQFEWWNVDVKEPTGRYTLEVKAKNKENAVRQFKKMTDGEILWGTLVLDRKGYQRRV